MFTVPARSPSAHHFKLVNLTQFWPSAISLADLLAIAATIACILLIIRLAQFTLRGPELGVDIFEPEIRESLLVTILAFTIVLIAELLTLRR